MGRWSCLRKLCLDVQVPRFLGAFLSIVFVFLVSFPVEAATEGSDTPAVADAGSAIKLWTRLRGDPVVVVESKIHCGGG